MGWPLLAQKKMPRRPLYGAPKFMCPSAHIVSSLQCWCAGAAFLGACSLRRSIQLGRTIILFSPPPTRHVHWRLDPNTTRDTLLMAPTSVVTCFRLWRLGRGACRDCLCVFHNARVALLIYHTHMDYPISSIQVQHGGWWSARSHASERKSLHWDGSPRLRLQIWTDPWP